jgi:hypothetical protein
MRTCPTSWPSRSASIAATFPSREPLGEFLGHDGVADTEQAQFTDTVLFVAVENDIHLEWSQNFDRFAAEEPVPDEALVIGARDRAGRPSVDLLGLLLGEGTVARNDRVEHPLGHVAGDAALNQAAGMQTALIYHQVAEDAARLCRKIGQVYCGIVHL